MKTRWCWSGWIAVVALALTGCAAARHDCHRTADALDCYFPAPPRSLPFDPFRTRVYSRTELLNGFDTNAPDTYFSTPDWQCYLLFKQTAARKQAGNPDEITARYMRLHDLSIEEALDRWLAETNQAGRRKVVGIMGDHAMERCVFETGTNSDGVLTNGGYSPYMKLALLAHKLATNGFTVLTAGGPGAMEAANLGAWMAGGTEADLTNAVHILSTVPQSTNSGLWMRQSFLVLHQYRDIAHAENIGVPTWFYGFEPPNPFPTRIAKYFDNSLREDHLLAASRSGIIFAPGNAGTVQEIFQSACQNYYTSYAANRFPMVLFGVEYWNRQSSAGNHDKPAWPLLEQLGSEKQFKPQLLISDDIDAIADFVCTNAVNQ